MATKLTDRIVRDLKPPPSGNRITYDTEISGFGLRVTAGNARSFILNYRSNGSERRLTIGAVGAWTVAQARERARELRRRIDQGQDPLQQRQDERGAPTI